MMRFIIPVSCALLMGSGAIAQVNAPSSKSDLAHSLNDTFADVYEKVSPGVVVIEVEEAEADTVGNMSPLYQFFMQDPGGMPPRQDLQVNQGSGFIISSDGYILTNRHVVEGATDGGIKVQLHDGRKFAASLVGVDEISDLAVIKVDADHLPVVELGDSDKVRVGEFAFALGSPYDLRFSFTYGIISAKGRNDITGSEYYEEYLQTDASINPGNSGGPLVDIDGRVIGVNTLIRDINRGLGFAIPINIAKDVATQLIQTGRTARPFLGLAMCRDDDYAALREKFSWLPESGVAVKDVTPDSPAELSGFQGIQYSPRGIRLGDVILGVDGAAVTSAHEIQKVILSKKIGESVVFDVLRNNRVQKISVRTVEQSNGVMQASNTSGSRRHPAARTVPVPSQPGLQSAAGMTVKTVTGDVAIAMSLAVKEGVLVTAVEPGSPAEVAGIEVGDIITAIGSRSVRAESDVEPLLEAARDSGVMVNFTRGSEKAYAILKL